jgi:integrase
MTPNASFKLKVRLPDGRVRLCGCGTRDRERYDAMRAWVQSLKRGKARRLDILTAIVEGRASLPDAYDLRATPDAILGLSGVKDLEPYVAKWHREKAASRKGAASADDYLRQVRELIPAGKPFPASRFTSQELRSWLRGLDVSDPTRNRYKAALSSFAEFLVDERALERNPVRDVRGFAEGAGRLEFYELEEAERIVERMTRPEPRGAFALAVLAGSELQVLQRLRARDIDLEARTVWSEGGKNPWRRRLARMLFDSRPLLDAVRMAIDGKLPNALLFPTLADNHVVLDEIRRAATAAQLKALTLHDQRHTHAVNGLRSGYKPTAIAHNLGHRDTTLVWQRYGRYVVDERDFQLTKPHITPNKREEA